LRNDTNTYRDGSVLSTIPDNQHQPAATDTRELTRSLGKAYSVYDLAGTSRFRSADREGIRTAILVPMIRSSVLFNMVVYARRYRRERSEAISATQSHACLWRHQAKGGARLHVNVNARIAIVPAALFSRARHCLCAGVDRESEVIKSETWCRDRERRGATRGTKCFLPTESYLKSKEELRGGAPDLNAVILSLRPASRPRCTSTYFVCMSGVLHVS
jgi:hypothetical protein